MSGDTDSAGAEGLSIMSPLQSPVMQQAGHAQTHRGLPVELLREIVINTFGSYFPELCINPEFDTSWDPLLSLLHSSSLLRSIAVDILEHALGDVFIDPHTRVLQNFKPAIKELHQAAVTIEKVPGDSHASHPVFTAMASYHVNCPVSMHAWEHHMHIHHIPQLDTDISALGSGLPCWLNMVIQNIRQVRPEVPLYIERGIFYPIERLSALSRYANEKAAWLRIMCEQARQFDSWLHHNSAGLVTEIPDDIDVMSQSFRITCKSHVSRRKYLR
ncbi:hypothetical protein DENSPDRAFT_844272 [Dentipellis sp. KUC8613]|nr:hypothetical protein DENSPDRAFT_844272 [Dentipellis sp. KUC8613]